MLPPPPLPLSPLLLLLLVVVLLLLPLLSTHPDAVVRWRFAPCWSPVQLHTASTATTSVLRSARLHNGGHSRMLNAPGCPCGR